MPLFSRILIVGVGLIGGSIGKAARQRGLAGQVVGLVRSEASAARASAADVVDLVTTEPAEAAQDADLVVICTPVGAIAASLEALLPHLPDGAIITDAGSTKRSVVEQCESLLAGKTDGPRFVGSHPLAGDHRTGPEASRADLLVDRTVIVTPTQQTDSQALERVDDFWANLGAKTESMHPGTHDAIVAETSHLPHLIASVLAAFISGDALPFTAGGWRDTTRIAAGDPELWTQIFQENRENIIQSAEFFRERLDHTIQGMKEDNWVKVKAILAAGKKFRDEAEGLPANARE